MRSTVLDGGALEIGDWRMLFCRALTGCFVWND